MSKRTEALADRLEEGARALSAFAAQLSAAEWDTPVAPDGRKAGVIIHHVASMYPIEIELAQQLGAGQAVVGVTPADVDAINARHAKEHDGVGPAETIELLERNSRAAAAAIRGMTDAQLDGAAPLSLNDDVVLTCQFMLEDHAVRHSYHHLAILRESFERARTAEGDVPRVA